MPKIPIKIDHLTETWKGVNEEMSKMKEDMLKFKVKLQNSDIIERNYRNHNLIIFGMDEYQHENKWDMMFRVLDLFVSEMHINIHEDSIDNCY